MTKENAEKFMALYQQHKAIAKRLAELDAKSEEALLEGLVKLAKELGYEVSREELVRAFEQTGVDLVTGGGEVGIGRLVCTGF